MTQVSWIEFVDDGMIVRFAYHQPRKIFFDTKLLLEFVQDYMDWFHNKAIHIPQNNVFEGNGFRLTFWKQNIARLELDKSVSGHTEMRLPKDKLIHDVCRLFAK